MLLFALLPGLLASSQPEAAPERDPAREQTGEVVLEYRDTELSEVLRRVGQATGRSFLFDDTLRGRVTIAVPEPVSPAEANEIVNAALLLAGYAVVPAPAGIHKVLKIQDASLDAPWRPGAPGSEGQAPVSTLIRLHSASAEEVVSKLRHLMGKSAIAVAYPPTNSVILCDSESRLHRVLGILRALDQGADGELIFRSLRYRSSEEVAGIIEGVYGRQEAPRPHIEIWSDARSNVLVARAPAELHDELRRLIDRIDIPNPGQGSVRVIRVLNRDAEEMAQLLEGVTQGAAAAARAGALFGADLIGRDIHVAVDAPTNSLLVRADPETHTTIERLVEKLDLAPHTISVEVIIFEVSTPRAFALGFDFLAPVSEPKGPEDLVGAVFSNPSGGGIPGELRAQDTFFARFTREPLVIPVISDGVPVDVVIPRGTGAVTATDRKIRTQILSRPHLLLTAGEEQEIFAGDNIPIPVQETNPSVTSAVSINQRIDRQDVGVHLRVRALLGEKGTVRLDLGLELSAVSREPVGNVEQVGPTLLQRQVQSTMLLREDEFVVVGLGDTTERQESVRGVPWLKDIPFFGIFFRTTAETIRENHLVVAVQARVLRTPAEQIAESIRRRIGFERSLTRLQDLDASKDGRYAVRIDTRRSEADATAIAEAFALDGHETRVSEWEGVGGTRFDIYLTGYDAFADAGTAALQLRHAGWLPEVAVLP
jgi:general secretion pathway protein D